MKIGEKMVFYMFWMLLDGRIRMWVVVKPVSGLCASQKNLFPLD